MNTSLLQRDAAWVVAQGITQIQGAWFVLSTSIPFIINYESTWPKAWSKMAHPNFAVKCRTFKWLNSHCPKGSSLSASCNHCSQICGLFQFRSLKIQQRFHMNESILMSFKGAKDDSFSFFFGPQMKWHNPVYFLDHTLNKCWGTETCRRHLQLHTLSLRQLETKREKTGYDSVGWTMWMSQLIIIQSVPNSLMTSVILVSEWSKSDTCCAQF